MKHPLPTLWVEYDIEPLWVGSYAAAASVGHYLSAELFSTYSLVLCDSSADSESARNVKLDATNKHCQPATVVQEPGATTDCFTPARRSEIMGHIRSKDTTPEMIVRRLLHRQGFRFRLHRKDLPGKPDIVLTRYHTIVNVHGCFWHGHSCKDGHRPKSNLPYWNKKLDRNQQRDLRVQEQLAALGWRTLVVWGCETRNLTCLELQLKEAITS